MRARFANGGFATVAALVAVGLIGCTTTREAPFDVLITGGQVIDGTGAPPVRADVGIRGDRIVEVGALAGRPAGRTIDATGLVVSPGFIDLHTHSEMPLLADGTAQSKVRQGVTLDVTGESTSAAPRDGLPTPPGDGPTPDWTTFTEYFARLEQRGISINTIAHVASEQVRRVAKGYDASPATPEERQRMTDLVARSMEEGAWGLVTRFESGGPEHPDEVLDMARTVARYGGNYTSHTGSEGYEQERELAFAIRVAEEAKLPVHVFHFKIRGVPLWGTIDRYIRQIEDARARGLDITANQYPYTAMFHGWSAFFPLWIREGGPARFAERLKDPASRARLRKDKDFATWAEEHGGWDGIALARARTEKNRQYEGKRIAEIARLRGDADPMDTCIDIMAEEGGNVSGIFHTMSEDDVRTVMRLPWVAVASDGSAINLDAPGVPHPRNYSTNVRVLGHYVRDEGVLTLPEAVRKMTSLPASILGLTDRGQLTPGFAADVVVFDPAAVGETNSFEAPKSYAVGVPFVLVNGVVVIHEGEHTGARPGRPLRGRGFKGAATKKGAPRRDGGTYTRQPMHREYHRWYSPRVEREMGVVVYGHFGMPLLAFPTSGGDELEQEGQRMIRTLTPHLEQGRIRIFSINSVTGESFYNKRAHPFHRSWMQAQYDRYVTDEVFPFIDHQCRTPGIAIATFGASLGAYHAANTLFKHPDRVKRCYALSGVYDMRSFMDGMYDDNFYFNNPVDYMANQHDPWFLDQYRSCDIRLATGSGPWENSGPTYRMSAVLASRGIAHHLDDWGPEGGHDWPYWHHQMWEYVGQHF